MRARGLTLLSFALATAALAGCLGGGEDASFSSRLEKYRDFEPTGRDIHLKMTVVDLKGQDIYPGYGANLWAFCVEPFDSSDSVSASVIETYTPLPGDAPEVDGGRCSVPGPTIRLKQGDRVTVEFSHSHVHPHTIHWHGQYVPWEADGAPGATQDTVRSGDQFTYEFVAARAGTLWYHCHVDTQLHIMQGLYGLVIVEPQYEAFEPEGVDHEYGWVLSTLNAAEAWEGKPLHSHPPGSCTISGNPDCVNPPVDVSADVFMVNGHSYPLTMDSPETLLFGAEGDRIRLRVLNAGTTVETLHPHGHDMLVTHRDGNPLPEPFLVDTLSIGPAERYDVVIDLDNPGAWLIHTHVAEHETNCGRSPGGMHGMLVYAGFEDRMHGFDAELPAACDYNLPVAVPQDVLLQRTAELPDTLGADVVELARLDFPVETVCLVRQYGVRATLTAPGGLEAVASLTGGLEGPDGSVIASFPLGGADGPTTGESVRPTDNDELRTAQNGTYSLVVRGTQAVQATVEMQAFVDYFDSYIEAELAAATALGPAHCTFVHE